ncbi:MAG: hypothetical protein WBO73_07085 [Gammaproteobacteria bacterium]|jgi:hypothetical protein
MSDSWFTRISGDNQGFLNMVFFMVSVAKVIGKPSPSLDLGRLLIIEWE